MQKNYLALPKRNGFVGVATWEQSRHPHFWALPGKEAEWAYSGDWVSDANINGPAAYYPRFQP